MCLCHLYFLLSVGIKQHHSQTFLSFIILRQEKMNKKKLREREGEHIIHTIISSLNCNKCVHFPKKCVYILKKKMLPLI